MRKILYRNRRRSKSLCSFSERFLLSIWNIWTPDITDLIVDKEPDLADVLNNSPDCHNTEYQHSRKHFRWAKCCLCNPQWETMTIFKTIARLLTFKLTKDEMLQINWKHFTAGLIGTWIVGIGRYWDDEGASLLQHSGLGSVIYIFLLALFIWLIIKPFFIEKWSYFYVLTFISLTSFPAIFYAIPVERIYSISAANTINVWFLAIVAAWRLTLLYYFLKRFTDLSPGNILVVTLMPICLIITTLTILNLHRVVFDIMGGRRNPTPHDGAYEVLIFLTVISAILILPLLIAYAVEIYKRFRKRRS